MIFERLHTIFLLLILIQLPKKTNPKSIQISLTKFNPANYHFILDVKMEKAQQLVSGIEGFDSTKLRHTETTEKNSLPDKDGK